MSLGGVGRNLAAAMELLGLAPVFFTSLAGDNLGHFARLELDKLGFRSAATVAGAAEEGEGERANSRLQILPSQAQSTCFALVLIDSISGQCEHVIANLEATEAISRDNLSGWQAISNHLATSANGAPKFERQIEGAPLVVLDANLPADTIGYLLQLCARAQVPIFLEPTDAVCLAPLVDCLKSLASEPSGAGALSSLAFLSPNVLELAELLRLFETAQGGQWERQAGAAASLSLESLQAMARRLMELHMPHLRCLLVTMDKRGVLVALRTQQDAGHMDELELLAKPPDVSSGERSQVRLRHYEPPQVIERPLSASGAGDCFAAGFISALIRRHPLKHCVQLGFKAAACALQDKSTVPLSLSHLGAGTR